MKAKSINMFEHAKKAVVLMSKVLRAITPYNRGGKMFFIPVVLMMFLFSCKKDIILPEKLQNETQQSVEQMKSVECGTTEYLTRQLASDPGLKSRMNVIESDIRMRLSNNGGQQRSVAQTITIPVVVHVVYNTSEQNISDAQVQSQIDVLNEDYTRTNADAVNTPAAFLPYAANANIHFVLAKRDPNGNVTNGITRTYTTTTSFSSNNYVKFNSYGGHDAWSTDKYLNIWVANLGLCGYATYPGSPASVDGVVIKYNCFGRTGTLQTSYNKGRTATHEVAHWLNVYHIWGDAVCGDDMVNDTPTQEKANYSYPVFPLLSSCSSNSNGDMFMNYMDYTADGARNMMTQGQVARMNATLNGPRAGLLSSLGGVAPDGTTTTTTTCNVPAGLSATSLTSGSATFNWSSTGAAGYNVRYKPNTSSTWTSASSGSTFLSVSGLSPSTNYEFQVAGVCSGTVSSAFSSSCTFSTLANTTSVCNVPAGTSVTNITKSSAALKWTSTGAVSYNVRYKPIASTVWISASTGSAGLSVSGLASSTDYEFQVAGVCSGSTVSNYSASTFFRTLAGRNNKKLMS